MRPSSLLRGSRSLELAWLCLVSALAAACGSAANTAKLESPRGNPAAVDPPDGKAPAHDELAKAKGRSLTD